MLAEIRHDRLPTDFTSGLQRPLAVLQTINAVTEPSPFPGNGLTS
jgi:hypothetical protein